MKSLKTKISITLDSDMLATLKEHLKNQTSQKNIDK